MRPAGRATLIEAYAKVFLTKYGWLIKRVLILLGAALIISAQLRLAAYWFWRPLNYERLIRLMPENCGKLGLCQFSYYPLSMSNVLLVIAAGLILIALGRPQALYLGELRQPNEWKLVLPPSRWRFLYYQFLALTLLFCLWFMVPALISKTLPSLEAWIATITVGAAAVYCRDRSVGNPSLFTRRELAMLVVYPVLLIATGMVCKRLPTEDISGRLALAVAALVVCWLLWYRRIFSPSAAILAFVAVAGTALYTYWLTNWRYAAVGDEYAFFDAAKIMVIRDEWTNRHPLSADGVYLINSNFASLIHAFTIKLYGVTIYGWRISDSFMVLLTAPPLYAFVRTFAKERAALFAVVVLASSQYLLGFSKIGYNNLQSMPVVIGAMALMALGLKRGNLLGIYLAGVVSALAFFTYSLAIFFVTLPLFLLALGVFERPKHWLKNSFHLLPMLGIFILGYFLVFYPRIVETNWLSLTAERTVYESEVDIGTGTHMLMNFIYSITLSFMSYKVGHYVYGAHLDPISSCLMLVGIGWTLGNLHRRRIAFFLIIAFVVSNFIVGGLAPYDFPAITRSFMFLIFYATFAGLGLDYLLSSFLPQGSKWQQPLATAVIVLLSGAILYANLDHFFVGSEKFYTRYVEDMQIMEYQTAPPDTQFYYISNVPYNDNLVSIFTAYGFDPARFHFVVGDNPVAAARLILNRAKPPYRVLLYRGARYQKIWISILSQWWAPLKLEYIPSGDFTDILIRVEVKPGDRVKGYDRSLK